VVPRLFLLRHGETEFSRQDRFCGRIDAPLTEIGRQMAACFADTYGRLSWRAIYTSTKGRAIGTAVPLATRATLPVQREPGLDEMDFGTWQGRSKREIAATDADRYRRWRDNPTLGAPEGESVTDVQARAERALEAIRARHAAGNVLIVSHKTTLRVLLCGLLGIDISRYRSCIAQPVCGLSIVDLLPEGPLLWTLADLGHLSPELRARALEPAAVESLHALDDAQASTG
jgi:alpha-ribazole phosphatase